jgi:hypothetical protein
MVMSISGTALATTALAENRKVLKKLEINWSGDGATFVDETSGSDDWLIEAKINEIGSKPWVWTTARPFDATFTLKSPTARFSYYNAASPIYSYIRYNQGRGIEVHFSVGIWDPTGAKYDYLRQFTGFIDYIGFGTARNTYVLNCIDKAFWLLQNKGSTIMYINQTVPQWLTVLCGAELGNIL